MSSFLYWFITASGVLFLPFVRASPPLIAPASHRAIPYDVFEAKVKATHSSKTVVKDISSLLYEVNDQGILFGPNGFIDLNAVTKAIEGHAGPSGGTKNFNGKTQKPSMHSPKIRRGNGYTVVYSGADGSVLSVWNNIIALKPLDPKAFPGIFIDTGTPGKPLDRGGDEQVASRYLNTNASESPALFEASSRQTQQCADGVRHFVELAVAYDNTFCALFGNSEDIASAMVQAAVNEADLIFQRDTCVSIVLVHIEAHCEDPNDPYAHLSNSASASDPTNFLFGGFKTIWKNQRSSVHRDLAYFFTGFEDGTGVAGVAYLSAACLNHVGYGWVEQGASLTLIHEIGHSLGAEHTSAGVMRPMLTSDPPEFSSASIAAITQYIDNYQYSSCIDTAPPTCDLTCPGRCVQNQCVSIYDKSRSQGLIPCLPVETEYRCTKTMPYHNNLLYFADDCPDGYDFVKMIGSTSNAFCCLPPTGSRDQIVVSSDVQLYRLELPVDGKTQYINGYIYDISALRNISILQSTLVPSCDSHNADGSGSPVPSSGPAGTSPFPIVSPRTPTPEHTAKPYPSVTFSPKPSLPSDPSVVPVPSFSFSPFPSWSGEPSMFPPVPPDHSPLESFPLEIPSSPVPTVTMRPSPIGPITCGSIQKPPRTFRCNKKKMRRIVVRGLKGGFIRVQFLQRSGKFKAVLSTQGKTRMEKLAAILTTRAEMTEEDLGRWRTLKGKKMRKTIVSVDSFGLTPPDGTKTCCGKKIYLHMKVKLCSKRKCVVSDLVRRVQFMRCKNPCRDRNTGTGRIVPFSESSQCPKCVF